MQGTLLHSGNKWLIIYQEDDHNVTLDVRPGRVEELTRGGIEIKINDTVDFVVEEVHNFPYRYAVPYISDKKDTVRKKIVKKKRVSLMLAGFPEDEVTIVCENYDNSSHGYWYFYDRDRNDNRIYLGAYPISRTAITEIEEIEVEIE